MGYIILVRPLSYGNGILFVRLSFIGASEKKNMFHTEAQRKEKMIHYGVLWCPCVSSEAGVRKFFLQKPSFSKN